MEFGTKEGRVRAQIEAVKSSLCAEGLADVADPIELQQAFDGFVTVRSTFNEKPHLLRLGFGWLEEQTPQGAVDWLRERHVADMLKDPDRREVRITDRGQIGGET